MKRLLAPFAIDLGDTSLVRAQVAAYTKQVPLLYGLLCLNTLSVAYTHHGVVPAPLTVLVPACLVVLCVVRFSAWVRLHGMPVSDDVAAAKLRKSVFFGATVGATFLCWSLALHIFGNAATRAHLNLAVAVTGFGCLFSLLHLRSTALILASVVVVPYAIFLMVTQDTISAVIGFNLLLVTGAMIYILLAASRDFESMVKSREEAVGLSRENFRLANVDSLTGLPNRRKFFSSLDALLERPDSGSRRFAVGLIDLDGFKSINDVYGHTAGDLLLNAVAERLQGFAADNVSISRLGGDEFGLLIDDVRDEADVINLGERICAALRAPFDEPAASVNVSASIGLAIFPQAGRTREQLFERADYAMYHGKQRRRGNAVIFDPSHEAEIRDNSTTERGLRSADLERELSVHFQPVFDVGHNRPIAFEALARWDSPELGPIPANIFIALAERTDLITRITATLLRKALAAAKTWPDDIRVSFNLSVRDLLSPASILQIASIVEASGVAAERIDFEVTETAFVGDFERARESIATLKALGARIALDDFGTGYSSLAYIHRLPLDKIKIDRSFVAGVTEQEASVAIVRTIANLCRSLRIQCVVEGAETAAQVEVLRELGCETMQGYFFGKPMPARDVADFIAGASAGARADRPSRAA